MFEFFLGFAFALAVVIFVVRALVNRVLKSFQEQVDAASKAEKTVVASVEEVNGMFYLYNTETGGFVVQGTSKEEMLAKLKQSRDDTSYIIKCTADIAKKLSASTQGQTE